MKEEELVASILFQVSQCKSRTLIDSLKKPQQSSLPTRRYSKMDINELRLPRKNTATHLKLSSSCRLFLFRLIWFLYNCVDSARRAGCELTSSVNLFSLNQDARARWPPDFSFEVNRCHLLKWLVGVPCWRRTRLNHWALRAFCETFTYTARVPVLF